MSASPATHAVSDGPVDGRWTAGLAASICAAMLLGACHRAAPVATPVAVPVAAERAAAPAAEAPVSPCTIVAVTGEGRDRDGIGETLASHGDGLRDCYAQLHARTPAAAGVARIQFVIEPSGLAGAALRQTSSVADATFSYCLAEALTTIAFADIDTGSAMSQTVVTCDFAVPVAEEQRAPDPREPSTSPI